ncbi:hypothetical protein CLV30_11655 [Haloactinopolyspora alba]|uniref:Sulfotransferase family protein n=1 Tax=Haloactinopolyspora alba TaxID=648780 RepID=A0A2P8DT69_9ACTN|nr:hypothetical protein [Haloactinopolyspora alba]PSL00395.1 hypothetical protein CLV30_11655 [Haloactinopolyspora alba]
MAERLVLHIGVQKSGTTYLQQLMQHRAHELAKIGVLYQLPSRRRLRTNRINHHELATYGLLGTEYSWVSEQQAEKERGWWERLQDRVHGWRGTAIVSAEALSVIRADAARRTVEAFGCPDNTDILITARGLGKLLPSAWQQHLRNGRSANFESFLNQRARERSMGWDVLEKDPQTPMWRAFALGRLAERWASVVGTDRVTVITNPGSPPEQLWSRFLDAAAVDGTKLSAPEKTPVHGGVTMAEAEILNSLNLNLTSAGWSVPAIKRLDKRIIDAFGERAERGPRVSIPEGHREQVEQWNDEVIAELRRSGVRVTGSIDELGYSSGSEPDAPTVGDVAEAAGIAGKVATEWASEQAAPDS